MDFTEVNDVLFLVANGGRSLRDDVSITLHLGICILSLLIEDTTAHQSTSNANKY